MVQRDKDRRDRYEEDQNKRRETREVEDLQATAASLQQQLDELQRGGGGARPTSPTETRSEKEQLKQLQRELKEERKKVAELEAEIAEQIVAREKAEVELAKLEEEEKLVAEAEREVKVVEEELRRKQRELDKVEGKIGILEGTLERLRKREIGAEESVRTAESEEKDDVEAGDGPIKLDSSSAPSSASALPARTTSISNDLTQEIQAAGEAADTAAQAELQRIREQTSAERRKADELEGRLRELKEAARDHSVAESRSSTPRPSLSAASTTHSSFAVQRLLKTITDANKTVTELRKENTSLLMQLAGV